MSNKKHIDRLFQEKFKDFEVKPDANVWQNIEKQINNPKPKTIIPLWLKYTSVAATLVLFLIIGNTIYNTSKNNTTVNIKEDKVRSSKSTNTNLSNTIKENTNLPTKTTNLTENETLINTKTITKSTVNTTTQKHNSSSLNNTTTVNYKNKTINNTKQIVQHYKTVQKNDPSILNKQTTNSTPNTTNYISQNTKLNTLNSLTMLGIIKEDIKPDKINIKNAIEEAVLANASKELINKEITNKWTINANISPVYYNTLGKGSHIDNLFVENPKNGEINTSYGVNVGYTVSKKLKVRSGISKLDLSYDTANVLIYNSVENNPKEVMRNVNFASSNQGQSFTTLTANDLFILQISDVIGTNLNAALSQRLSYIEVPLELEYALINKKVGFNIIGGASAFFLNENEIVSEIDNRTTTIGEANNINTISYSANIGLGLDYKFNNHLKFNIEPTFKYQIDAYNNTSGDFRPYIIGVYTGFSYKF